MAAESKPKVICVAEDNTGRARCKECTCLTRIEKGNLRVGAPMFAQGRTVTAWFHPHCFIKGIKVEECPKGNGGKCKVTKAKIGKGDFRALIRCGSAKFGLGLKPAKRLLEPVLEAVGINFSEINGANVLPEKYSIQWNEEKDKNITLKNQTDIAKSSEPLPNKTKIMIETPPKKIRSRGGKCIVQNDPATQKS